MFDRQLPRNSSSVGWLTDHLRAWIFDTRRRPLSQTISWYVLPILDVKIQETMCNIILPFSSRSAHWLNIVSLANLVRFSIQSRLFDASV
jgi:hypothetical protein